MQILLNFIPWVSLVLQKKESSDLGIGGTLPGLCRDIVKTCIQPRKVYSLIIQNSIKIKNKIDDINLPNKTIAKTYDIAIVP